MIRTGIAVVVAFALILAAAVALALPKDQTLFKETYAPKEGTALASAGCLVCHTKMPATKELNPYGKDYLSKKTRDAAALKAIETLDSDKDGFNNITEIRAGTLPGDPTSKPK
jgi:mono/diheme cytochrome c family protein